MTKTEIKYKCNLSSESSDELGSRMDDVDEAMDIWADYKVGEAIAGSTSVSHEYEIPKHILEEFSKQECIEFMNFALKNGWNLIGHIENRFWRLGSDVKSTEELFELFIQSKK